MNEPQHLDSATLGTLLRRAHLVKAPTSLRAEGSNRVLGDLQLRGLEPGAALHLLGAKRRDQLPEAGTVVTLSILLGDEVLSIRSTLLEPLVASEGDTLFPPVLRVAWPQEAVTFHHRQSVRVAAPDQAPLDARVSGAGIAALGRILNLTDSGLGLGLAEAPWMRAGISLEVEAELPGVGPMRFAGEVRHTTVLADSDFPVRAGLRFRALPPEDLERLRRFIQNRRTDRSEGFRQGGT